MSRRLNALTAILALMPVLVGWALAATYSSREQMYQIQSEQSASKQDMVWIKETLSEIKAEVKRERK